MVENMQEEVENLQKIMEITQKKMEKAIYEGLQLEERNMHGSHVCFEVPTSKEETPDWFHFEEKLIRTAVLGCDSCLALLITGGADVNIVDMINCTPLMKASRYGHLSCVHLLLEAGADVNITDIFGIPALGHAVAEIQSYHTGQIEEIKDQEKCAEILVKVVERANVNGSPEGTETALMSVASFGNVEWLQSLLEAGCEVNRRDRRGNTALMKAAAEGHVDCLQALLDAGADVNALNEQGWDALTEAACAADESCVSKLIEAGSKINDDIRVSFLTLTVSYRGRQTYPYQLESTYRCIQQFLKVGAYINCPSPANALEEYISGSLLLRGPVHMLLLAAGETVGEKIKQFILKDYMKQEDQNDLSLKHLSREAVRKQMIAAHPHDNLFQAVNELDIPKTLRSYLVYDMSLADDDYDLDDFFDFFYEYGHSISDLARLSKLIGLVLAGGDPQLVDVEKNGDDNVDEDPSDEENEEYEVGQEEVDEEEYEAEVEANEYEEEEQESEDEEEEVGQED